jgi:predicted nucleic acid-binding protein
MNPTSDACAKPAVVLDTNAALDWLVFRDPGMHALAAAIQAGQLRWLQCAPMRRELLHMVVHPSLAVWKADAAHAAATIDRWAVDTSTPTGPHPLRCTDPDDQIFIDLALASGARWLVTHDRALLKLARRARPRGLAVLKPAAWPGPDSLAAG